MLVDSPTTDVDNTNGKIPGMTLGGSFAQNGSTASYESIAEYWSSSASNNTYAQYFKVDYERSKVTLTSIYGKYIGVPIRCMSQ